MTYLMTDFVLVKFTKVFFFFLYIFSVVLLYCFYHYGEQR